MEDDRIHREDPERSAPRRNWTDGHGPAWDGGSGAGNDWQQAIENSVRLGYELIDSQIREGRRMAEQFGGSFFGTGANTGTDNMRSTADGMARSFVDLTTRWFEAMSGAMAGKPFDSGWPANGQNGDVASGTVPLNVEVASEVHVRLSLDFEEGTSGSEELFVPPLCDKDSDKLALDVTCFPPERGRPAAVRIEVPNDQPAGFYSALIYDRANRQLRGRLTVEIPDSEEPETEPSA